MAEQQSVLTPEQANQQTKEKKPESSLELIWNRIQKIKEARSRGLIDGLEEKHIEFLQEELKRQQGNAKEIARRMAGNKGEVTGDDMEEARQIQQAIETYVEASKLNLLPPPTDKETKELYQAVVKKLEDDGISRRDAVLLEPIINGLFNRGAYVRFSSEGQEPTQFEQDLKNLLRTRDTEVMVHDIVVPLISQNKLGNLTIDQFKSKIEKLKKDIQPPSKAEHGDEKIKEIQKKHEAYKARLNSTFTSENERFQREHESIENRKEAARNDTSLSEEERNRRLTALEQESSALRDQQINKYEKPDAVSNFLYTGEVSPPFTNEDEIRSHLRAQGFSDSEIDDMRQVFRTITEMNRRGGRGLGANTGYDDLGDKIEQKYSSDILYDRIIKDGKIDIAALSDIQANIEDDIGILFDTLYNSPKSDFQEAFSPYSEGQMLRNVIQHLRMQLGKISERYAHEKAGDNIDDYRKYKNYADDIFRDKVIAVTQRRQAIEQVVHQYQQMGATIDLQNLQKIYQKYDITTLQEFYNDDLTRIMSDLMPQFVQKKIIENGNKIPPDLFQLVQEERKVDKNIVRTENGAGDYSYERQVIKYMDEFIDFSYDVLKGQDKSVTKDRIKARVSRAYLVNFLLTLEGIKVMARAIPPHANFEDVPFGNIISGVYNPRHGWKPGQHGRGQQRAGDAETYEMEAQTNFMFNEVEYEEWRKRFGDIYDDFHPEQIMKEGKSRILYKIFPNNEQLMKDLRSGKWDVFQTFYDVYHGLGAGNILDQGGWPFEGFNEKTRYDATKDLVDDQGSSLSWSEVKDDPNKSLEAYYRTVGVVPAFHLAGDIAGGQARDKFLRYIARDQIRAAGAEGNLEEANKIAQQYRLQFNEEEWDKILDKYTVGEDKFKKIHRVRHGDQIRNVSQREYALQREIAMKGKVFHQLLLKDPIAWLGEMSQMLPEITEGYVSYKDTQNVTHNVLASEFFLNISKYPDSTISKEDKVRRDRFRFEALTKFRGKKEDDFMTNIPHLKKIMDMYANLGKQFMPETQRNLGNTIEGGQMDMFIEARKSGVDRMYMALSKGHQMAVNTKNARIDPKTVIEQRADGTEDRRVHDVMYGDQGLVSYFENLVKDPNYFGDGNENLGEENGFYQRWAYSNKQTNRNTLPEGDTNWDLLLKDVKSKQALERRLATNITYAKAQEVMGKVPSTCKEAGNASTFEEWYGKIEELHKEMATLADEDQGVEQKYQMELFIAICNYFSLDSNVEKLFMGVLEEMRLGKNKAIVSIKADYANKFMLDADARRTYLRNLRDKTYIKGGYDALFGAGIDTVESVAGISAFEIYGKQLIYTAVAGAMFIVAYAIKEGYEEEAEGKKK